jgi:hypothetical protein
MLFIVVLVMMIACSNEVYEEVDIKEFVMEYKTEQYTVEDPSNPPTAIEIGERVKLIYQKKKMKTF